SVSTVKSNKGPFYSHECPLGLIASFYLGLRERSAVAIGTTRPSTSTFLGGSLVGTAVFFDPVYLGLIDLFIVFVAEGKTKYENNNQIKFTFNFLFYLNIFSVCGHRVALEYTNFIRFFNNTDESFVTGGKSDTLIWIIDYKNSKLISSETVQGHLRRIWTTAVIDNDDKYAYYGSIAGDIVAFDIQNYYLKHFGPVKDKDKLQAGISQLELFNLGDKGAAIVAGRWN
ncbi:MAG: hypothetical protein EZS28_027413, partial [Streblomastix strix]